MDSITHTLFGLTLYGTVNKQNMDRKTKLAYLFTTIGASQIPDSDVISRFWDNEGLYQMWHRGITHSIFLTPLWALLFYAVCILLFRIRDIRLFFIGWLAVAIHNTSDLFNAWGTGYLEPFSNVRITLGTIPIIDFIIWIIIGVTFYLTRKVDYQNRPKYFKYALIAIALHFTVQSIQGYYFYEKYKNDYDQIALSAGFIPTTFQIVTKKEETVSIYQDGLLQPKERLYVLTSSVDADLDLLFTERPEAKTLYEWSPFVVIVDDGNKLGIFDPRFYRNGQSFLFEYITR